MRRPLVAITATSRREAPTDPERLRLNAAYVDAIVRAGGIPVVTPPVAAEFAAALADRVDALLLTGGEDVAPSLFGAEPHPALGRVTPARDVWEIALVHAARQRRMATLGVCRGIQTLNVALGGTLIQDIPSALPDALVHEQPQPRDERTHVATVTPGSRLESLVGAEARVNSMHHQSIADLAPGFTVSAVAPDGVIEAVEWTADAWWCLGVQWHPEELDGADAKLFAALIAAATSAS